MTPEQAFAVFVSPLPLVIFGGLFLVYLVCEALSV